MMEIRIKWNRKAIRQFDEAITYIEKETTSGAEKLKQDILLTIDSLRTHPEKFHPDKYKLHNDGSFRAFEMHHYRVSYRFKENDVVIIRIRHTKMNPQEY